MSTMSAAPPTSCPSLRLKRILFRRCRSPSVAQCGSDDEINHNVRPALLAFCFQKGQCGLDLCDPAGRYRDQQMTALPAIGAACDLHGSLLNLHSVYTVYPVFPNEKH